MVIDPFSPRDSCWPRSPRFVSLELGLTTVRLGAPKIWPDKNVAFTPFAARYAWKEVQLCTPLAASVLVTAASSQGNCLSDIQSLIGTHFRPSPLG